MTGLGSAVRAASATLREAGVASPEVDAVELAAHVLGVAAHEVRRRMIVGGSLPDSFDEAYAAVLAERARRVPLQHLTGRAPFRTLTLHVGPGVFVPRPETEVVVELALAEVDRLLGTRPSGIRLVDLCSGSGAIALAVKTERPRVHVRAIELSGDAVAWATANRDRLGLDVAILQGDATEPAIPDWSGSVDLVTANPPYIPSDAVPVDPEVRDHDPEVALYGGSEDGLAIPLRVAAAAAELLGPGGLLLMEHADTQGESLPARLLSTGQWSFVVDHVDLSGRPRVTAARRA
ncbi:peptide chain release factor N(5)-glutamine methyltransferase [Intrasporangium calvum]|uniref:Release factor glutamine methyltransferase n=1 Tax=Intrasporangium calvum (strain ATCC 23552 / DSM 43043 / JCM 3097 / NBRC 12989 / NCIMB 10167 / NRRL B-3866 / 7 KIP) TaxID=710696 RepID=E6S6G5_INTC7|nr:peptide chain release factor N(5)-glutamine methyltransferase [Intrasporangium calvum]ADU48954.1 protein-(glutamine-N5) methyltransferase, release factor-specific [Intrasporangium calvum DSM 43043]AXG13924.1 peptide chain release factor N(5)-glutamine methyltransferase [Intrasporangium calvum]